MSDFYISLEPDTPLVNFEIGVPGPSGPTGPEGPEGPEGPAGPNSVTSATTSDGTANLSLSNVTTATATVSGTLTANHIHGNIAGSVYAHVRAGEDLAKGDPVYVSGFHSGSGYAEVKKADASDPLKMPAVGVMDAVVTANNNGHMVITGTITDLDTDDYAINATLYVAGGGGWTDVMPSANAQPVARVERSNQNNGAVIVKVNGILTDSVTSATTSDGTANLDVLSIRASTLYVSATAMEDLILTSTSISSANDFTGISFSGESSGLTFSGIENYISTLGENSPIQTYGINSPIATYGNGSYISTRDSFRLNNGTHVTSVTHSPTADRSIKYPDKSGTLGLDAPYKNDIVPRSVIFEDFPTCGNAGAASTIGTHGWTIDRTTGASADTKLWTPNSSIPNFRAWGVIRCTTHNTTNAYNSLRLSNETTNRGQSTSPYGLSIQVCFAVADILDSVFYIKFGGEASSLTLNVFLNNGVIQLLREGNSPITLASSLSFSNGNFVTGNRYRLFFRPISQTQTEIYLAVSAANSDSWTELINNTYTHLVYSALGNNCTVPYVGISTQAAVSKTAYIDWVAIHQNIDR